MNDNENNSQQVPVAAETTAPVKPKKKKFKPKTSKVKKFRFPNGYAKPAYLACKQRYPDVFTSSRARPLALGITEKLIADAKARGFEELHPDMIRAAVQRLTEKEKYLQAVVNGDYRYNIDGTQAEAIEASHKNHGRYMLRQIVKRRQAAAERAKAAAANPVPPETVDQIAKDVAADMPAA